MKITANRRDDLIKQRDAFDSDRQARTEKQDAQYGEFKKAMHQVFASVEDEIRSQLAGINLDLTVDVRDSHKGHLEAKIECNDNNPHAEGNALAWRWSALLKKDGTVEKESSSWSGLKACTDAELDSLEESVKALRIINNLDWENILAKTLPDYDEYVQEDPELRKPRPNFENDIIDAELEEAVGKHVLFKGSGSRSRYTSHPSWYGIIRETSKQYEYVEVPPHAYPLDEEVPDIDTIKQYTKFSQGRITKDKFIGMLKKPLESIEY